MMYANEFVVAVRIWPVGAVSAEAAGTCLVFSFNMCTYFIV